MAKKNTNRDFEIEIFYQNWKVRFVDRIECEERRFVYGETEYAKNIITLAILDIDGNRLSEKDILKTFFHELIHAISAEGYYLDATTEPMTEFFARIIVDILQQLNVKIDL